MESKTKWRHNYFEYVWAGWVYKKKKFGKTWERKGIKYPSRWQNNIKWIECELKCQYNFFILITNVIFTGNNILNYSTNCPSAKISGV